MALREKIPHRKAIAAASAAAGLFGAYLLGEMYREQHNFRVTRYEMHPGDGQRAFRQHAVEREKDTVQTQNRPESETVPVRIVFLSDLHNYVYGKDNASLLQAVKAENPDLILIGGDMLTAGEKYSEPYDRALSFVGQLPEIAPVYYACGNHEQRMKEYPEKYPQSFADYRLALQKKGVIFLENESAGIAVRGRQIVITGLEIPLYAYRKFRRVSLDKNTVMACLNGTDKNRQDLKFTAAKSSDAGPDTTTSSATQKEQVSPETESAAAQKKNSAHAGLCAEKAENRQETLHILLAHNPVYMYAYKSIDADLVLCGHLHGGIARLPGIGGVFSPQTFFFPKYSGEMTQEEDRTIIVSKGLGAHTIKLRLWNYPEVVSISIT